MKTVKKPTTKNLKMLVISAIRKLWRNYPPRNASLELACIDKSVAAHNRQYRCAMCNDLFLKQQCEINHLKCAPPNESLDEFVRRIFLNIASWKGDEFTDNNGIKWTKEALAQEYLEVLCKNCHKIKTKTQNKQRRLQK